ncbi:hypothetical protein BL864_005579, partial [Escherichia coli]|nr:hypothetical protein [Escherichia coli]
MAVTWIEHRFAGGVLALDVANTVVLRIDPDRAFDRFADMAELPRFAAAASRFRTEELGGQTLVTTGAQAESDRLTPLRESIDALFRDAAGRGDLDAER